MAFGVDVDAHLEGEGPAGESSGGLETLVAVGADGGISGIHVLLLLRQLEGLCFFGVSEGCFLELAPSDLSKIAHGGGRVVSGGLGKVVGGIRKVTDVCHGSQPLLCRHPYMALVVNQALGGLFVATIGCCSTFGSQDSGPNYHLLPQAQLNRTWGQCPISSWMWGAGRCDTYPPASSRAVEGSWSSRLDESGIAAEGAEDSDESRVLYPGCSEELSLEALGTRRVCLDILLVYSQFRQAKYLPRWS